MSSDFVTHSTAWAHFVKNPVEAAFIEKLTGQGVHRDA